LKPGGEEVTVLKIPLRAAGVAVVLALSLSTALAAASVGVEATTGRAMIAKKKCKKAKAQSAKGKRKCKGSLSFRQGGNYTMFLPGRSRSFGLFRYAGAGLFPNPRPVILSPRLDGEFLDCKHDATGYPRTDLETAGHTYPNLKKSRFSFSFPLAGVPEWVKGQIHMEGHWVTPSKIVGFFSAQGVGYKRPLDPEQETEVLENFTCTDVSTPFVALAR
jgi:hypothetical protein